MQVDSSARFVLDPEQAVVDFRGRLHQNQLLDPARAKLGSGTPVHITLDRLQHMGANHAGERKRQKAKNTLKIQKKVALKAAERAAAKK